MLNDLIEKYKANKQTTTAQQIAKELVSHGNEYYEKKYGEKNVMQTLGVAFVKGMNISYPLGEIQKGFEEKLDQFINNGGDADAILKECEATIEAAYKKCNQ